MGGQRQSKGQAEVVVRRGRIAAGCEAAASPAGGAPCAAAAEGAPGEARLGRGDSRVPPDAGTFVIRSKPLPPISVSHARAVHTLSRATHSLRGGVWHAHPHHPPARCSYCPRSRLPTALSYKSHSRTHALTLSTTLSLPHSLATAHTISPTLSTRSAPPLLRG